MAAFVVVLLALAPGALREPPTQVKYAAAAKGEVTFDHTAHLARREKCASCHGEGAVQKIEMGKARAHVLCIGCHGVKRKGPVGCTGCHLEE